MRPCSTRWTARIDMRPHPGRRGRTFRPAATPDALCRRPRAARSSADVRYSVAARPVLRCEPSGQVPGQVAGIEGEGSTVGGLVETWLKISANGLVSRSREKLSATCVVRPAAPPRVVSLENAEGARARLCRKCND